MELHSLNKWLFFIAGGLSAAALFLSFGQEEVSMSFSPSGTTPAPYQPLALERLEKGPFALAEGEVKIQLPNLQGDLAFVSANTRPDATDRSIVLRLRGEERAASLDEPLFIRCNEGAYGWSQEETGLWIEPKFLDEMKLTVKVEMRRANGESINEPQEHSQIVLNRQEKGKGNWSLGPHRVDTSLFSRLKARWLGQDLFLAQHGGEEFNSLAEKQRLDFGEGDGAYSCFVSEGDVLIWNGERWCYAEGATTALFPLLQVKRIDEKLMVFDLWDIEGRHKTPLSLMKGKDDWKGIKGAPQFAFGKTHSQFLIEVGGKSTTVVPNDWLLLREGIWQKLETIEELDQYVSQQLQGELLVIDGLSTVEGQPMLEVHGFNPSRTRTASMALALAREELP